MNVLVNKNAPFLRGGGDKLKYFVVVSVVSVVVVVVCCGDIDIDIIIDRTLKYTTNTVKISSLSSSSSSSRCVVVFVEKVCLVPQNVHS